MINIDFPLSFNRFGRTAAESNRYGASASRFPLPGPLPKGEGDSKHSLRDLQGGDHVRDMIEQFLFTNHGERVNRPDFGSGLLQMIFAPNSQELASTLQFTIQAGLQRWLGDVLEVLNLDVSSEDSSLRVFIQYRLRQSGEIVTDEFVRGLS